MMKNISKFYLSFIACVILSAPTNAASYTSLEKKGYIIGPLTKGKSGKLGWFMKKGDVRYFCKSKVSMALVGSKGLVSFTTSGRQLKLDRKTFEKTASIKGLPQLSDIKAGRVTKREVGRCSKQR